MRFDWDPRKSARNAEERSLPFEVAMALFDGHTLEFDDQRRDYGERRIISFGAVAGRVLVCVYTWRGSDEAPLRWIISLRKANKGESDAYGAAFPERAGPVQS
ncbi:MAG TPA: BrnT family toxin [Afifellaceae bacterium]|nr:BrnT family toxin [Afifellaceae bacterium]